jgi:hypothetical protein
LHPAVLNRRVLFAFLVAEKSFSHKMLFPAKKAEGFWGIFSGQNPLYGKECCDIMTVTDEKYEELP